MKKIFYSMLAIAMATFTLTSCEDVPEPYTVPGENTGGDKPTVVIEPTGDGTLDNPFNSVAANNKAAELDDKTASDEKYYIKGKVVSIRYNYGEGNYPGTADYYISDDGTTNGQFYVYASKYLGDVSFSSGTVLQVGDEVVIYGNLYNYGGTYETATNQSYLYSLNGKTTAEEGGGTIQPGVASGDGTLDNPFNSVAANNAASALADKEASEQDYYIKGKVVSIRYNYGEGKYPATADYYISDDGTTTDQFYVYASKYLGNTDYSSGEVLKVGDEVIVYGKLYNYGGIPETATNKSYLYSLNGKTSSSDEGGGTVDPGTVEDGESVTIVATDMGFDDKAAMTTCTLSDGTILTFDKGEGTTAPTYYAGNYAAARMYAKNTLTINANKIIKKVSMVTNTAYNGTLYNGNDQAYAQSGSNKVSINKESETSVSFNGLNNSTITIVNDYTEAKGGTQLRIKSLTITYAK